MNSHGIYCLFFECDNNKFYVGKSLNIALRYSIHCRDLRNKVHHNIDLQAAYYKYKTYPSIETLETPSIDLLTQQEIYWINKFDSFKHGYNRTNGGDGAGFGHYSPSAKYDEDTYACILYFLAYTSMPMEQIAKELKVSKNIVASIALGDSHLYLKNTFPEEYILATTKHGDYSMSRKYDNNLYYNILFDLANTRDKYSSIASRYNVSDNIIEDIGRGSTHKYLALLYPELYNKAISRKGLRRAGPRNGGEYPNVISPDGIVYKVDNATAFAKVHGLHQGHFASLLSGKHTTHKGWKTI